VVSALDRKLLRDLARAKGQGITIALVVACGIAAFVGSLSTGDSLVRSRDRYYETSRFADVFAALERAPSPLEQRIAEIPGIAQVETRLVFDVTLDVEGHHAPTVGRMVSLPDSGPPRLNRLHLRRGRMIEPGRREEVLVSEGFASAHGLMPGDRIAALLNGRRETLHIVGIALSPEFVFPIRAGDPLPDDESFGILWIGRSALAAAFNMEGAFNDVVLRLGPYAREAAVLEAVDRLLDPYGGLGAYGRDEQTSHRFLADEIEQQRVTAATIPVVFLGVAAFLLNIVLGRLVHSQRSQIATLKAIGYDDARIGLHYLELAAAIVLAGAVIGVALGAVLGERMTAQYTQFFRFPALSFRMEPWTVLLAVAVSLLAGAAGTALAVRQVVSLAPSDAMRPPAPPSYRHALLERIGLTGELSPQASMLVRGIAARPLRFALTSLGVACAMAIVVLGLFWRDALDYMVLVQFRLAERGDAVILLREPRTFRAVRAIAHLGAVEEVEGQRSVAVTLRAGHRSYRTAVQGLAREARLRRLLDLELRPIAVSPAGILLTRQLGERLGVEAGDLLEVDVREGERPRRTLQVAGLVDDLVGLSAYMDIDALHRLMEEGETVNGVVVRIDRSRATEVYEGLKQLGEVAAVVRKKAALEVFEATTATFVLFFTAILTVFAIVIAVGVVYNTARIALQERSWELASLRVLGFTRGEVSALLLSEIATSILLAVPAGLFLGKLAALGLSKLHATELFRIPVVIAPRTYGYAALVIFLAGTVTALLVRRRVDHLDLVSALKANE
jgi:putative ABC transport system permease protein